MNLEDLKSKYELLNLFLTIIEIPSPPLKEENVANKIIELLKQDNIECQKDNYGNIVGYVEKTDSTKKPLMLSAHMDVVGDDSHISVVLSDDLKFIETDKKRTLGADNKAGVAGIIMLAKELSRNKNIKHGGLEFAFTRDEEKNLTGIKNLKTTNFKSENVLVLDADKLGQLLNSGAGYKNLFIKVSTTKGGHSGLDIGDKTRLNAAKLICEIVNKLPQGAYKFNENNSEVITSLNLGAVIGGGIDNAVLSFDKNNTNLNVDEYISQNSMTNIINTSACACYSIRSSRKDFEDALLAEINEVIKEFNEKYKNLANATVDLKTNLEIFEKSEDNSMENIMRKVCDKLKITPKIGTFHAGAETHIFCHSKNASEKNFSPYLLGIANIYNMHSCEEKIDWQSYLEGFSLLKEVFLEYNQ